MIDSVATPNHGREQEDVGPRWKRNLLFLFLSQVLAMVGFSSAIPFLPLYVQTLGVEASSAVLWAGTLSFSGSITMAVMAPVWGMLADRHGRKSMVTRSMFAGGIISGLMSYAESVQQLLALRTIQGAFSGTVSASRTLAAGMVPRSALGQSMGLMQTAAFVGQSLGPLIGGFVADHFGYRASFMLAAVLLGLAGLSVLFFVEESFARPLATAARPSFRSNVRLIVFMPEVRAVILSLFVVQVGQMAASPILPLFIQELLRNSASAGVSASNIPIGDSIASTTGLILGVTAFTSAAAASVGGKLGDRVGHRRILAIASIATGILYLPQAFVTNTWQLLAVRAILGAFAGALMPVGMALIAMVTPSGSRGWIFGITATATALGVAIGPVIGALIATAFGLRASFIFTSVILCAGGLWITWSLRTQTPAVPSPAS